MHVFRSVCVCVCVHVVCPTVPGPQAYKNGTFVKVVSKERRRPTEMDPADLRDSSELPHLLLLIKPWRPVCALSCPSPGSWVGQGVGLVTLGGGDATKAGRRFQEVLVIQLDHHWDM